VPLVSPKAVNASEEFLGQRDDDVRRASQIAEPVHVLVLGHLAIKGDMFKHNNFSHVISAQAPIWAGCEHFRN
jgi:hypothetical protein